MKRWTRLVEARAMRGLTQRQVADLVGIGQSHYCDYEAGKQMPRVDKVRGLAKALDVPSDFLFDLDLPKDSGVDGIPLSDAEVELVRAYRRSSRAGQKEFDAMAAKTRS